jgi:hypothetical protein
MGKTIGETNGPWSVLFKLSLVLVIPLFSAVIYLVSEQSLDREFRLRGDRFTKADATELVGHLDDRLIRIETKVGQFIPANELVRQAEFREVLDRLARIETLLDREQ